jgi:uncharacterized protein (DUF2141 family)
MKHHRMIYSAVWMAIVANYAKAQGPAPTCQVSIHVDGFRNQKGDLGVTVFKSPEGWPEDNARAYFHHGFPISGNQSTAQLDLPPGRYAIAILHDENSNRKLDRNFIGIPKEGFGFSNNPKVHLTAPGFDTASAEISCPTTDMQIHLVYK